MASTEILLFVAAIATIVYFWTKHYFNFWRRNGIPHVRPTPIIGNVTELFGLKTSFGINLNSLYNEPGMTDEAVVGFYAMHKPALIIREPELMKSVLIKDFNKFSNRYASSDPHGDFLGSNNLFFVKNPLWRELRTKLTPVFTSGKIRQMYPLMLEIGSDLEAHLAACAKTGNSFITEVKEVCALFTTDLVASIAFGIRVNSLKYPDVEFRARVKQVFVFNILRTLDYFVAFFLPKFVTLFRVKIFSKKFSKYLRHTINHVISERELSGGKRNDLIDILVKVKKQEHFSKNNDYLVAQAAAFITAGFGTSSSIMAFALYELAKQPELQKRLREEIVEALLAENGTISYENINSLEYLNMVLDEVMRMYPVLPFLDRQYSKTAGEEDFTLKPYYDFVLPDGTPVFVPLYSLHRDPKYWPNPEVFDPQRFTVENKKLQHPMTYLPFGSGPHNCIANRIGVLQSKIGLVHIFKNHRVEVCEKTVREMKFDPRAMVLQCEGGISLNVIHDHLYDDQIKNIEMESNKTKLN